MLRRSMAFWLFIGLTLGVVGGAFGQVFPLGLLPAPPASDEPLNVYVWTTTSAFDIGDPIEIRLSVNRPAFLYLFDLQPDGVVRLLFPNAFSPNNYVPGTAVRLPDGSYSLIAQPPPGIEELLVFATLAPLSFPVGTPTDPFPVIGDNPQDAIEQLVTLLSAIDPTLSWAVGWTAIQITGESIQPPAEEEPMLVPAPPSLPPFTGQPGSSWYVDMGSWFPGIPADGWYWHYGIDRQWHLCWVYAP